MALHDATAHTQGEDTPAILSLERLGATLERAWEEAKTREAKLLEHEAELLALVCTQQEAQQRLLEQGRRPKSFVTRMITSWRRLPASGLAQP